MPSRGPSELGAGDLSGVDIRVLGPLEIACGGQLVDLRASRLRALFCRLVLDAGRVVRGEKLAEDLWPGVVSDRRAATLRNLVFRLRRVLEQSNCESDRIETHPDGYRLRVDRGELDVHAFEELTAEGRRQLAEGRFAQASDAFREALALWRGRAFGELADEEFARAEAVRLEELRLTVLEDRIDADLACGRHTALVGELEKLTAEHVLRERLWSQRMLSLYRAQRQAEALRVFQQLRELLASELGLDPSPALRRVEAAILAHDPGLDWHPPQSADPTPLPFPAQFEADPPLPCVGRERELQRLREMWYAVSGRRRVALVTGDAGIGKTRLARELSVWVHEQGGAVLFGRCDEESLASYQPFLEILLQLGSNRTERLVSGLSAQQSGALARLVPSMSDVAPAATEAEADADSERFRLFEAVTSVLNRFAGEQPALLVFDDLQWADAPTLVLFRHLLRSPPAPMAVLATYREADLDPASALGRVIVELAKEHDHERVPLGGLDQQAVAELVARATARTLDTADHALVRAIHRRSEGNPFFAGQLLRHALESGATAADVDVPEAVRDTILQRLATVSPPTRRALDVAAVFGQEFDLAVVTAVAELTEEMSVPVVDEAVARRLVEAVDARAGRFRFAHALIRAVLYESVPEHRRLRLHRRVADALEERGGGDVTVVLCEIAYHRLQSASPDDAARAVSIARQAADQAMQQLAFERAAALYRQALAVMSAASTEPAARGELLLALARACVGAHDARSALSAAYDAGECARVARDPVLFAEAALVYEDAVFISTAFSRQPEVRTAAEFLEEAADRLGPGDSALRVLVLARLPRAWYGTLPLERLIVWGEQSMGVARRLADDALVAQALHGLLYARWGPDNVDRRLADATTLAQLAARTGPPNLEMVAHFFSWLAYLERGERNRFDQHHRALLGVTRDLRDQYAQWFPPMMRATVSLLEGRLDDAERAVFEAGAVGEELGATWAVSHFGAQLFCIRREQGRLAELEPVLSASASEYDNFVGGGAILADLYCELGRLDDARAVFDRVARNNFADVRRDCTWFMAMHELASVCARLGDAPRAGLVYQLLSPFEDRHLHMIMGLAYFGSAARDLGVLATTQGRWDIAERHLHDAIEGNRRFGSPPLVARAQCDLASLFVERDDPADRVRAQSLLEEAWETAATLGLAAVERRAEVLGAAIGIQPPRRHVSAAAPDIRSSAATLAHNYRSGDGGA